MLVQTLQKDAIKLAEFSVAIGVVFAQSVVGTGVLWFYFA